MSREPSEDRPLRVELFGGPSLLEGSDAVSLSPYQLALLTLVYAHEEGGISRARAIWLLWEESDGRALRQRMRQLLHAIRKRARCDPIRVEGDRLAPAGDGTRSDLRHYHELLAAGELRQAASLHREGFAVNLPRIPTEEFEDWLQAKRQQLRRLLRDAGARGWDAHYPQGDWQQAREAAEALYALDPSNEAVVRRVIEARAMTGSREGVEAAYTAFLETLGGKGTPGEETVELVERVRTITSIGWSDERSTPEHIPLVGRGEALAAGRESLNRVRHGSFEFVLVSGEAGIGKTRLLDELKQEAHVTGFRCLQARPVELEQRIPLNPLLDALAAPGVLEHIDALEEPWRAVIAALLPADAAIERTMEVPYVQESSLSRRLLDAFALLFASLASERPTVLFLDNLQWADETTLAVLQFVQRRWQSGPLGVVASIRPELVTFADPARKYLEEPTDLEISTIPLEDLSEGDAVRLVRNVGGEELSHATCRRLCDLGGRNPFYIIELTKDYLAGKMQLPELPSESVTVPISLQQLFDARLEYVSQRARKAAEILAVWARWMKLDDLAALAGMSLDGCVECVEELAGWRLVQVDCANVRVAHELFRSALYQRLSDSRRSVLHRAVAEHLVATADSPLDSELAIHYARAGVADAAVRYARRAARESLDNGAVAEAAHFMEIVVSNESDEAGKADATADLARLLHMNREIARANPLLELASVRLRKVGSTARALRMEIRRVDGLAEVGATPIPELVDRLRTIKDDARNRGDWEAVALALDVELHLLDRIGNVTAIRSLFEEMKACAAEGSAEAACLANASLALNVLYGDGDEALRFAREAVELAEAEDLEQCLFQAQNRLLLVLHYRGMSYLPEGQELIARATEAARSNGDLIQRCHLAGNLGAFHMEALNVDQADVELRRALSMIQGAEADVAQATHFANLGELELKKRNIEDAAGFFRTAEGMINATTPAHVSQLANAGLGICALEAGSLTEARRREARIPPDPWTWYYDQSPMLVFRVRMMERRGMALEALDEVAAVSGGLKGRLTFGWLKVLALEARIAIRAGVPGPRKRLEEALPVARSLILSTWVEELQGLLERTMP